MQAIWTICTDSYRDAWRLVQQARMTLGIAALILIGAAILTIIAERLIGTRFGRELAGTLLSVGAVWLAAPYLVSLYRYLLAGETVAPASLRGSDAAERFFGWSAVLAFVTAIPGYVIALFAQPDFSPETATQGGALVVVWGTMALLIAAWIFTTRTITLLPAAALGETTDLRRALAETRGRFWFIVGAVMLPTLPVALLGVFLTSSAGPGLSMVFAIIMVPVLVTIAVAVTANLYRWLMDHPK